MPEKIWHLKHCRLFEVLSLEVLASLESQAKVRTFPRKGLVYLPQDAADSVGVLASGRIKITNLTSEGKQAILTLIEPGELFGELAVFDSDTREEYAEAMEKSTVVLLPTAAFQHLLETQPSLALGITKLIGLRRKRIERRLKHLLFRSNRERVVHLLLELAEQYGKPTERGIELQIKLSHQDLSAIIGSTRESVTVVLGELQEEGLIQILRRRIVLSDVSALAQAVEAEPPQIKDSSGTAHNPQVQYR
ncbi:Transcriptional regulator [Planctomycetales bacterium 10988]|nr:Transcriptional regulator [Planctomycetales bacterium 10988]